MENQILHIQKIYKSLLFRKSKMIDNAKKDNHCLLHTICFFLLLFLFSTGIPFLLENDRSVQGSTYFCYIVTQLDKETTKILYKTEINDYYYYKNHGKSPVPWGKSTLVPWQVLIATNSIGHRTRREERPNLVQRDERQQCKTLYRMQWGLWRTNSAKSWRSWMNKRCW